jgi:hypothetical protein
MPNSGDVRMTQKAALIRLLLVLIDIAITGSVPVPSAGDPLPETDRSPRFRGRWRVRRRADLQLFAC